MAIYESYEQISSPPSPQNISVVQNLRGVDTMLFSATSDPTQDNYSSAAYGFDNSIDAFSVHGHLSDTEKIIVGVVCSIMIIVVLAGNGLVVAAVVIFRHIRTPSNILLLNLAVADITVAALVMTFSLGRLLNNGVWVAGEFMCKLWMSLDVLCCTASILNLCMVSLDKYWAITRPLSYNVIMSRRRTTVMISIVWILSSVISFVPIFSDLYAEKKNENLGNSSSSICSVNFSVNKYYAVLSAATSFYLPLAVMLFTYYRIYMIAHSQIKRILLDKPCPSPRPGDQQVSAKKKIKTLAKEFKAVRTLGLIMGCFMLCWLPFFLMYIIMNFCATCSISSKAEDAIVWLGYANSMINPLIYNVRHVEFKKAFRAILTCRRMRSLNREASLAASASDLWATNSRRGSLRKLSGGSANAIYANGIHWNGTISSGSEKTSTLNGKCMSAIPEVSTPRSHSQEQMSEHTLILSEHVNNHDDMSPGDVEDEVAGGEAFV